MYNLWWTGRKLVARTECVANDVSVCYNVFNYVGLLTLYCQIRQYNHVYCT